jgi:hypothetical protein
MGLERTNKPKLVVERRVTQLFKKKFSQGVEQLACIGGG